MAASVFVPIMQYHSEYNHHRRPLRDRTPWNIAEHTGDARVIPVTRDLVHLRERLVPYLSREARHTIATSIPLMRPVYFDHPGLETAWTHPLQWFLGRDVFVSPVVTEGVETHEVALPPGEWVDAATGRAVPGDRVVDIAAPVGAITAFVRAEAWPGMRDAFGGSR
jgi:alpha-glucosidase (family GH31 glycosyl hydrolase)